MKRVCYILAIFFFYVSKLDPCAFVINHGHNNVSLNSDLEQKFPLEQKLLILYKCFVHLLI